MSSLPRVTVSTRERISREFDDLGPEACVGDITAVMATNNPELLDMARRCAGDLGGTIMVGLCFFYRLLAAEASAGVGAITPGAGRPALDPLPRLTPGTRTRVAATLDEKGEEQFMRAVLRHLERHNPELLQAAHRFASRQTDYARSLEGFALLYAALVAQAAVDRKLRH
jgi:hypothetical protein